MEELNRLELLKWAGRLFGDQIALCSAFGPEEMVLLHLSTPADFPKRRMN